jgi:hypothetical protein
MGLGDTDTIGLIALIIVVGVIFIAGKLQQRRQKKDPRS